MDFWLKSMDAGKADDGLEEVVHRREAGMRED